MDSPSHLVAASRAVIGSSLLERLQRLRRPIRVGIIGIGAMGRGLLHQCSITPGIRCVAVADLDLERCRTAADAVGASYQVAESPAGMERAIARSRLAVCQDGDWVAGCDSVDVLVEASSSIVPAARFALRALQSGKHVVLMNAEVDLAFGPHLLNLSRANGVVCTSCDGDQHGVIKHLVDELTLWGFELVMAGNIKGYLDRYANPTTIVSEADKRYLDHRMATAYTDGTKLGVEMALLANALGLSIRVPGMLGPRAQHVSQVFELYDFERLWQDRQPCADYILGAQPDGGVFAVGYNEDPYQRRLMAYYKMGGGPFYLFYRPYHLCHVEAMSTIAAAALDQVALLQPLCGRRADVFAVAKRPLSRGSVLEGIGGYDCYGLVDNYASGPATSWLPICLAEGMVLKRDLAKDERIALDDVQVDPDDERFAMYDGGSAPGLGSVR